MSVKRWWYQLSTIAQSMGALKWRTWCAITESHQWVSKYSIQFHVVFALQPCNQRLPWKGNNLLVCVTSVTTTPGCGLVKTGLRLLWCCYCSWFSCIFWFTPMTQPSLSLVWLKLNEIKVHVKLKSLFQIFASFMHKPRCNIWHTHWVFLCVCVCFFKGI